MTFKIEHYEYLADTILNDPDIPEATRRRIYNWLLIWFNRDMENFNPRKWTNRWVDHFHSDLNSPVQPNASESKE